MKDDFSMLGLVAEMVVDMENFFRNNMWQTWLALHGSQF